MPNYANYTYPQLKKECARLGLGGAGNRDALVAKLEAYAEAEDVPRETPPAEEYVPTPEPIPEPPPRVFANWDEDGKWVRRPKGFISWEDEKRKAG